jgi:hypothetical protein
MPVDRLPERIDRSREVSLLRSLKPQEPSEVGDDRVPDRARLLFGLGRLLTITQPLERELEQAPADLGRLRPELRLEQQLPDRDRERSNDLDHGATLRRPMGSRAIIPDCRSRATTAKPVGGSSLNRGGAAYGSADATSVWLKSRPLNSNGSPRSLASA